MIAPSRSDSSLFGTIRIRVEILLHAEAQAGGQAPYGLLKENMAGRDLRVADAAIRAGKFLAEDEGLAAGLDLDDAPRLAKGSSTASKRRRSMPSLRVILSMITSILCFFFFRGIASERSSHFPVELDPGEPLPSQVVDFLAVLAFASPYDGGKHGKLHAVPRASMASTICGVCWLLISFPQP